MQETTTTEGGGWEYNWKQPKN